MIKALLEGGADPAEGTPSAVDTARMFAKTELLELFGAHWAQRSEQPRHGKRGRRYRAAEISVAADVSAESS